MNLDAKEAVLGLLSMGHATGNGSAGESSKTPTSNHHHHIQHIQHHQNRLPHHHHQQHPLHTDYLPPQEPPEAFMRSRPTPTAVTSSATLNSILTTMTTPTLPAAAAGFTVLVNPTTTSTIPAKRKPGHAGLDEHRPRARDGGMIHLEMGGGMSPLPGFQRMGGGGAVRKAGGSTLPPPEMPMPRTPTGGTAYVISSNNNTNHVIINAPATPVPANGTTADVSSEPIDCMCGSTLDDGFSIACDDCGRWCHGECFEITKEAVPELFHCARCMPRSEAVREAAARMMREKERLGLGIKPGLSVGGAGGVLGVGPLAGGLSPLLDDGGGGRRKQSPGTERKQRRLSTAGVDGGAGGGRRKRRLSVVQPHSAHPHPHPHPHPTQPPTPAEDEPIDIDEHPWAQSYVHVAHDIIPNDETRSKLRRQAQHWRGVTAVSSPPPPQSTPSPVAVKELPLHATYNPLLSVNTNPQVLPPAYALHTTQPVPSDKLITPFTSTITPSSTYLSDPLNAYAHLGMPKPHVHLVGPPLDLALDARIAGNQGRFVRNGCRPNAVLRPTLCPVPLASSSTSIGKVDANGKGKEKEEEEGKEETSLGFGVFSLRDLKAGEEIVLGWEWDDGNAVHHLPALLNTPHMFPSLPPYFKSSFDASTSFHKQPSPNEIRHIQNQMSNILHALSSTFTTCACGARAKDCALTQMAAFVDRVQVVGGSSASASTSMGGGAGRNVNGAARSSPNDNGFAGAGLGTSPSANGNWNGDWNEGMRVDLGPLVGRKRGFKTRERIPFSGGIGGMEMDVDDPPPRPQAKTPQPTSSASRLPLPPNFTMTLSPSEDTASARRRSERVKDKGKGRALLGAGNGMEVDEDVVRGRSLLSPHHIPPQHQHRHHQSPHTPTSPLGNSITPSSSSTSSLQPRPPDHDPDSNPPATLVETVDETKMPPKMRKKWMHREVDAHAKAVERERDGVGVNGKEKEKESPDGMKWAGAGWGGRGGVGLGIRFGIEDLPSAHAHIHAPTSSSPSPAGLALSPAISLSIPTPRSMLPPPLPHPTTNSGSISNFTFTPPSASTSTITAVPISALAITTEAAALPSAPTPPPRQSQSQSAIRQLLTPSHTPVIPTPISSTSSTPPPPPPTSANSTAPPTSAASMASAPPASAESTASTTSTTSTVRHPVPSDRSASFASPLTGFASLSLLSPAIIGKTDIGFSSGHGCTTTLDAEGVDSRRESVPPCGEWHVHAVETENENEKVGEDVWTPITRRERRENGKNVEVEMDVEMKREDVALVLTEKDIEVETTAEREEIEERETEVAGVEDVEEADTMDVDGDGNGNGKDARGGSLAQSSLQTQSTLEVHSHPPQYLHHEPSRSRSTSIASSTGHGSGVPATTVAEVVVTLGDVARHEESENEEEVGKKKDDDEEEKGVEEDVEMRVDLGVKREEIIREFELEQASTPLPTTGTTPADDSTPPFAATAGTAGSAESLFDDDDVEHGSVVDALREEERGWTEESNEEREVTPPAIDVEPPSPSMSISSFTADPGDVDMDVPALPSQELEHKSNLDVVHEHEQEQRAPSPSPPPPTSTTATTAAPAKVKLSLRDFVLRKKKMKEQEKEAEAETSQSAQASPLSVSSVLGPEGDLVAGEGSGAVEGAARGGGGTFEEKTEGLGFEKEKETEREKEKEKGTDEVVVVAAVDDRNARAFSAAAAAIVNGFHLPKKPVPSPASTPTPPPPTLPTSTSSVAVAVAVHVPVSVPPQPMTATPMQARPATPAPSQQPAPRRPPTSASAPTPAPAPAAAAHLPERRHPPLFHPPQQQPPPVQPTTRVELPHGFILARQQARQRAAESNKAGRPPIPIPASLPARPKSVRASSPPPSRSRSRSPSSPSLPFSAGGSAGTVPLQRPQPRLRNGFDFSSRYATTNTNLLAMRPMAKHPMIRDPPLSSGKMGSNVGSAAGAGTSTATATSTTATISSGWNPNALMVVEGAAEKNVSANGNKATHPTTLAQQALALASEKDKKDELVTMFRGKERPQDMRIMGAQAERDREALSYRDRRDQDLMSWRESNRGKDREREREEGEITSRGSTATPASQTQTQPLGGSLARRIFAYSPGPNANANTSISHRSPPTGPRSLQVQTPTSMWRGSAVGSMGVPTAPRSMLAPSFDREEMGRPRIVKSLPFRRNGSAGGGGQSDAVEGKEGVGGGRNVNPNSTSNTDANADSGLWARRRMWQ